MWAGKVRAGKEISEHRSVHSSGGDTFVDILKGGTDAGALQGRARARAQNVLPREAERRGPKGQERVVELPQPRARVAVEPVRSELLDHQLAEGVVEVPGVPRPALRLPLRGQPVQERVLHEEPGPRPPPPTTPVDAARRREGSAHPRGRAAWGRAGPPPQPPNPLPTHPPPAVGGARAPVLHGERV